jgi:hypothetical protein
MCGRPSKALMSATHQQYFNSIDPGKLDACVCVNAFTVSLKGLHAATSNAVQ